MQIYLVRHGIAQDPAEASSDAARRLTEEGHEKTARVAHEFRKRVSRVDLIFHSPYLRAAETARIFAEEFPKAKLVPVDGLTPHDAPQEALSLITATSEAAVMLVGHEPQLSSLASRLMTGKDTPLVEFKKAGIAGFECYGDLERCRLSFFLSPKWL